MLPEGERNPREPVRNPCEPVRNPPPALISFFFSSLVLSLPSTKVSGSEGSNAFPSTKELTQDVESDRAPSQRPLAAEYPDIGTRDAQARRRGVFPRRAALLGLVVDRESH